MGSSLWRYCALRRASCFLSAVMEAYLGMTSVRRRIQVVRMPYMMVAGVSLTLGFSAARSMVCWL